jgi:creatinine amidohydrolase
MSIVRTIGFLLGSFGLLITGYLLTPGVFDQSRFGAGQSEENEIPPRAESTETNTLSPDVQMQFMRPGQLEAAGRRFPVAYVPFGCIEWHGRHLPLGTDALKAHGILVKCAERYGGAVYPPVYFHSGFDQDHLVPVITNLFQRLKASGFRVIIGVSGHNVKHQIEMIDKALEPVVADGTVAGIGLWEISLSRGPESNTDHAAKWETSDMMFFYPETVDLLELGTGPLAPKMKPPDGIGGKNYSSRCQKAKDHSGSNPSVLTTGG